MVRSRAGTECREMLAGVTLAQAQARGNVESSRWGFGLVCATVRQLPCSGQHDFVRRRPTPARSVARHSRADAGAVVRPVARLVRQARRNGPPPRPDPVGASSTARLRRSTSRRQSPSSDSRSSLTPRSKTAWLRRGIPASISRPRAVPTDASSSRGWLAWTTTSGVSRVPRSQATRSRVTRSGIMIGRRVCTRSRRT